MNKQVKMFLEFVLDLGFGLGWFLAILFSVIWGETSGVMSILTIIYSVLWVVIVPDIYVLARKKLDT